MDINPSLQICGWNVNGSAFCPGAQKRVPPDSEKHLHVYTSSHMWRVDTATGKTLKKRNVC